MTVAALLAGGDAVRIMHGAEPDGARPMGLARVLADEDLLLLRYVRRR